MKKQKIAKKIIQALHNVKMRDVIGREQTSTPTDPSVDPSNCPTGLGTCKCAMATYKCPPP